VVAPFPIKKDGIIGLDLLRALGASIDIAAEEIELNVQKIKLTNHAPGGVKRERGFAGRSRDPRKAPRKTYREKYKDNYGVNETGCRNSKGSPAKPIRTESPTEGGQVEELQHWGRQYCRKQYIWSLGRS
jgi:hypothetical protein